MPKKDQRGLNLPEDLVAFLNSGRKLEYDASRCECGRIGLLPLSSLEPGRVWVTPEFTALEESDPHKGEEGYYEVPAVNLVGECPAYDPEFILLWLPEDRLFGGWDSDHGILIVFPDATWTDVVRDPLQYIQSQWDEDYCHVGRLFVPWPKYEFKPGRPF